mgnify:CR=1 FL=1
MLTGIVKSFDTQKRFGFIAPDDGGNDLFVHTADIKDGILQDNYQVTDTLRKGQKGLCAENVNLVAKFTPRTIT